MVEYYNLFMINMKKLFKNSFKKQVFISYARKDKEYVESFIKNGQNRGFDIFVDETDKQPGINWKERILDKIYYSDAAFLFISKNSLREDSPIRELEIPEFINQNNIKSKKFGLFPKNKFQFFPVFIDYVDQEIIDNFNFKSLKTGEFEKLFTNYDIWNLEANDKSNKDTKMPSSMSEEELNAFWAELNLQMTNAVKGRKITKMGSIDSWSSNRKDATQYLFNSIKRIIGYIFLILVIGYLLFLNNQESDQTSEVFNIGPESVRIAALNTGDCFDLVNKDEEIGWNTYVQYRACDLLHDGEVFYRENQLDFGDNQVSYTNLLNLFTKTCNSEFSIYQNSPKLPDSYEIQYYWDTESQALGTKPFDMLCLTLYENRTRGSYVEDVTGISILLPNPGNKYDCDDFESDADAQTWYELYFDDYGDVALLDLNNNGIACDEIDETEDAQEVSTTSLVTTATTNVISDKSNNNETTVDYENLSFDVTNAIKNSKNKELLTTSFDILNKSNSWAQYSGLRIETHWKTGVYLKWNGCDFTMGCMYKLSINGVNFGSHLFDGSYYTTNNNIFVGGLNEASSYEIKLEPVDSMYQTYQPVYLTFTGSDWDNDDNFNPGWPLVNEVEGYKIYADQNSWRSPQAETTPKISIADQGVAYAFSLLDWSISTKYTHIMLFVNDELVSILGNNLPQYIQIEKSLISQQTLNEKIITLVVYDSPIAPGVAYSFEYKQ